MTRPLPIFHYTTGNHLQDIGESGVLRTTGAGMLAGVRPAVWLSTNQVWERTVDCGQSWDALSGEDDDVVYFARICVRREAAPYRWSDYRQLSGEPVFMAKALAKAARNVGANSREWRCSFDPIPRDSWLWIDVWNGYDWEDVNFCIDQAWAWLPRT